MKKKLYLSALNVTTFQHFMDIRRLDVVLGVGDA